MKILVIGGGGREHALVWKLQQSPKVEKIYCAPGNAGIGEIAALAPIGVEEIDRLADFAASEKIDLTVVGPELPLTLGIAELFQKKGLRIFGPGRAAAQLEGSKAFAKEILSENHIPTAAFGTFSDAAAAKKFLAGQEPPYVIKADGLAAGKGVLICSSRAEAESAIDDVLVRRLFGAAGDKVVIEEFLAGDEASFMVLTDGDHIVPLASSQDHKRVFDGDKGPNTGGMGAYSPAPVVTKKLERLVMEQIMVPTVQAMEKEGRPFKGILYAGLMINNNEAKVLEFNARFGDPETQPVMMRLDTDLIDIIEAILDGNLSKIDIKWKAESAVCVVMASGGYPGDYEKGKEIKGLENAAKCNDVMVFHAGTKLKDGKAVTDGGRVLGVTGLGPVVAAAIDHAYAGVREISFEGAQFRMDIGARALETGN
jgi:phosphoribosylamine--glycine ligase